MKLLSIIISTLDSGILSSQKAVQFRHPEVCYLVVHQNNNNTAIPDFLKRPDIKIVDTKTRGLSKSRNIGIANCKTDYALIADDDVEYIENGIIKVLEILKTETPDFAAFQIKTLDGEAKYKNYEKEKTGITHFLSHAISSIEIILNVNKIREKQIKFDERFGLGTKLKKGEEEILIHDCISAGMKGQYYPEQIVTHPYESSGKQQIKESFKYFFKGAEFQRIGKKQQALFENFKGFRKYKNIIFFQLGKLYIKVTP